MKYITTSEGFVLDVLSLDVQALALTILHCQLLREYDGEGFFPELAVFQYIYDKKIHCHSSVIILSK